MTAEELLFPISRITRARARVVSANARVADNKRAASMGDPGCLLYDVWCMGRATFAAPVVERGYGWNANPLVYTFTFRLIAPVHSTLDHRRRVGFGTSQAVNRVQLGAEPGICPPRSQVDRPLCRLALAQGFTRGSGNALPAHP